MKRLIAISVFAFITIFSYAFSQQNNNQQIPLLKPTFIVSDVYVAITILNGVEIKGNEVDAFLEVKNTINGFLTEAKNKNLKAEDKITVELPGNIAQNTVTFMSRATLKGNLAEAYKRFVDAIVESAKQNQK